MVGCNLRSGGESLKPEVVGAQIGEIGVRMNAQLQPLVKVVGYTLYRAGLLICTKGWLRTVVSGLAVEMVLP